jgi:hypothetical protein
MSHAIKIGKPIRSALLQLHAKGIAALQPTKLIDSTSTSSSTRQKWKRPVVSKRIAKDLRKKAIREGTYGSYDPNNGVGWDQKWDEGLFGGKNVGKVNWMEIRGFKDTKRERTRESRAKRVEGLLTAADEKIVEYRQKKRDDKPEGGIENVIKRMMRGSVK